MKYRDGYEGQVAIDEYFQLPDELWPKEAISTEWIKVSITGIMITKAGYSWDYATVPFTKWLSNKIAGKKSKTPSLAHDALCQLKRNGLLPHDPTRLYTDTYFHQLLLDRKFFKPRAWAWFKAVRIGAKYHKQKPKKVYEVP
jgi:hypothetical protein